VQDTQNKVRNKVKETLETRKAGSCHSATSRNYDSMQEVIYSMLYIWIYHGGYLRNFTNSFSCKSANSTNIKINLEYKLFNL